MDSLALLQKDFYDSITEYEFITGLVHHAGYSLTGSKASGTTAGNMTEYKDMLFGCLDGCGLGP